MRILIIQGPNLNLIGTHSADKKSESRITLDKINRGIRHSLRNYDNDNNNIKAKIIQSHDLTRVITVIQRNRNWADAVIIAPSSWSSYEHTLKMALEIVDLPIIEVYFSKPFQAFGAAKDSILSSVAIKTITGDPEKVFIKAIQILVKRRID
jgi:3-dehydroquinate dehydratase